MLTNYKKNKSQILKKGGIIFFSGLVLFNFFMLLKATISKEKFLMKRQKILSTLVSNNDLKGKKILLIGLPQKLFMNSLAQELWILGFNRNIPIYYDQATYVSMPYDVNKIANPSIYIKKNKLLMSFNESEKACFKGYGGSSIGKLKILHKVDDLVKSLSILLDNKYLLNDIVFVTWDYENNKFKLLD